MRAISSICTTAQPAAGAANTAAAYSFQNHGLYADGSGENAARHYQQLRDAQTGKVQRDTALALCYVQRI